MFTATQSQNTDEIEPCSYIYTRTPTTQGCGVDRMLTQMGFRDGKLLLMDSENALLFKIRATPICTRLSLDVNGFKHSRTSTYGPLWTEKFILI